MEKYRKFADPFTGINPFVPCYANRKIGFGQHVIHFTLGLLLLVIRLPLFLLSIGFLIVFHHFLCHFLVSTYIKRIAVLIVNFCTFRFILLLLGFYTIDSSFRIFTYGNNPPRMKSGFVVVSNHTSPVDIFYFNYIMSPIFTKIFLKSKDGSEGEEVLVAPLSFWESLKMAFSLRFQLPVEGTERDLAKHPQKKLKMMNVIMESFDNWHGPLLVFFEGAQTNGQAVLRANEQLLKDALEVQNKYRRETVMFQIKYSDTSFYSPINTTRHPILHLLLLMTSLKNTIKVTTKTMPYPPQGQQNPAKTYSQSLADFYSTLGTKTLDISWKEYSGFLDYWELVHSSKYVAEQKKSKSR